MPVYNVEAYLHQAVISILDQSFGDFELLAVNDGSTDLSKEILGKYQKKDSRITIIDQSNKGLSAARNTGLAKAKGQYIYFFDSDDELVEGALTEIMDLAEKTKSDVIHFSALAMNEHGKIIQNHRRIGWEQLKPINGKTLLIKLIETGNYATNVQKYVIKKKLLDDYSLRFDKGFIHEDESFTIEMICLAEKITSLDKPLMLKRFRKGSIMRSEKGIENIKGWLKAAIRLQTFIKKYSFEKNVESVIQQKIDQLEKISLKNLYRFKKRENNVPDLKLYFDDHDLNLLGKSFHKKLNYLFLYMLKEKFKGLFTTFSIRKQNG